MFSLGYEPSRNSYAHGLESESSMVTFFRRLSLGLRTRVLARSMEGLLFAAESEDPVMVKLSYLFLSVFWSLLIIQGLSTGS